MPFRYAPVVLAQVNTFLIKLFYFFFSKYENFREVKPEVNAFLIKLIRFFACENSEK